MESKFYGDIYIKIGNRYLFNIIVSILCFCNLIESQERIINIYIYFLILQNEWQFQIPAFFMKFFSLRHFLIAPKFQIFYIF